jgi:glycerophosphoryl diester phosphodiesterase
MMLTAVRTLGIEIIAHRGASYDAPENSLSSMKLAWEQKADAIETDLWLTSDGKIAIFHDATTKRYDGQSRKVSDLSLAELQQLDIGKIKGASYAGEKIPSFEDILATIPEKGRILIEIKCGPEILPAFVRVIRASKRPAAQLCVISFNYDSVKQSRALLPEIEHYLLAGYKKDPMTGQMPELGPLIDQAKQAQLTGLDLQYTWPFSANFVSKIRNAGLKLFVWTVDDRDVASKLTALGVDGITTNRPAWLREQLEQ